MTSVRYVIFSLKNYINVPSKSNKQKTKKKFCWRLEGYWRAGSGSESISQRYESADPDPYQNSMDFAKMAPKLGGAWCLSGRLEASSGAWKSLINFLTKFCTWKPGSKSRSVPITDWIADPHLSFSMFRKSKAIHRLFIKGRRHF